MNYKEPVLLIDIVANNCGKQILRMTQEGEDILNSITDKVISVVGIAGP